MTTLTEPGAKQRIVSIDIVRGLIMLFMAIDHTRDFFIHSGYGNPTNITTTTPVYFFTRWMTHFCAPNFVFLSGVSAYLAGKRRSSAEFRSFLIKRGLWLIFFEIVFVSFALTLDPMYHVIVLQVIWAIGMGMTLLALLSRASLTIIAIIGLVIVFGHDIIYYFPLPKAGAANFLITMFFTAFGSAFPLGKTRTLLDLYSVIPWFGVMLVGYVFGSIYVPSFDARRRKRILRITGLAAIALFIIFRYFNLYGDPAPWSVQRTPVFSVLSFLNTSKYSPSLLFLCMTIGPALVALSFLENVKSKFTSMLVVYGNVPFFYYFLHIYLIRVLDIVVFFVQGYHVNQIVTPNQPFNFQPLAFGFGLGGVYLMWLLIITVLYFPCRWYSQYKRTHHKWWLSYL